MLRFSAKIAQILNKFLENRCRNCFAELVSRNKRRKNAVFELQRTFLRKLRQFFKSFCENSLLFLLENRVRAAFSAYFAINRAISKRKQRFFKLFSARQRAVSWKMRVFCEILKKIAQKSRFSAYKRLQTQILCENRAFSQKMLGSERISRFLQKFLQCAFLRLKQSRRKKILRGFLQKSLHFARFSLKNWLLRWRGNVVSHKISLKSAKNRVKGRFLLSLSKNFAGISQKTAFFRWKIRSGRDFLRKSLQRY